MSSNPLRQRSVRGWGWCATLGALLATVAGCDRPPPVKVPPEPKVERLVVVTPHNEMIQSAFEEAFSEWHKEKHGSYIQIRWVAAGTPQCVQYVQAAGRPDFVPTGQPIPDVLFGGGPLEHHQIAEQGLSRAVDMTQAEADLPPTVAGIPTRDEQNRWHSSALSGFGILVARQACRQRGIAEPTSWADLADPRFYGWLALADPERSGSNRQCLLIILQKYGWDKGWGLIMRMAANCRSLQDNSEEVISNVSTGQCLAGFCVSFNALRQIEQRGHDVLAYVAPSDASAITPDPISVLTYALHPEIGERFARFCVSEAGQKVWGFRAEPHGGRNNTLFRYPINPKFYTQYKDQLAVPDNPFERPALFPLDLQEEKQQSEVVGPLLLAACGDQHVTLQRCWRKVIDAGLPEAALAELLKPIVSESAAYAAGERYRRDSDAATALMKDWSELFRQKYERVEALLTEPVALSACGADGTGRSIRSTR
jgi:iron(III) transport system substrate-binding protein